MEKTATLELTETQLKTLALWLPRIDPDHSFPQQYVTHQDRSTLEAITDKTYGAIARL